MPPKRKYSNKRRAAAKKYGTSVRQVASSAKTLQAAIRRTLFKNAESKSSVNSSTDYRQIEHNNFIIVAPNNILTTNQGPGDPENSNILNRIGDKITLMKAQFRMMIELNERYSDVTYRILLVRSPRGDTPSTATLFNGLSGNKMLDTINYQRYSILFEKWGKIKAPNISMGTNATQDGTATGIYYNAASGQYNNASRATQIIKFDIPGARFGPGGVIQYDADNSAVQKTYDYNLVMYAYSNFSTSALLGYNVLAINDYYHRLVFKDF